ncbi:hypothetical protein D3C80_1417420 [compost metagenome]
MPPTTSPSLVSGRMTFQNTCSQLAPSTRAAAIVSFGMFSSALMREMIISGRNSCRRPMKTAVSENRMRIGASLRPTACSA